MRKLWFRDQRLNASPRSRRSLPLGTSARRGRVHRLRLARSRNALHQTRGRHRNLRHPQLLPAVPSRRSDAQNTPPSSGKETGMSEVLEEGSLLRIELEIRLPRAATREQVNEWLRYSYHA